MYSYDLRAAEIRERQNSFHRQGRIDRQAREAKRARRAARSEAGRADPAERRAETRHPWWQLSRWAFHGPAH